MFQTFTASTRPADGPPRLRDLREALGKSGLDGFLVPRADAHQGEYVAPRDERLSWLTGFTGSAGFCAVLPQIVGVFIDGRYTVQVRTQVDTAHFTPVAWPTTQLGDWLVAQLPNGGVIGFDPWLHTEAEIDKLRTTCGKAGITFQSVANPVDTIWLDQPDPPMGQLIVHPLKFAGESATDKIARLCSAMTTDTAVVTLPDSIAWLLNIRGSDIVRNPVPHVFALLHKSGTVDLFCAPEKISPAVSAHLGPQVRLYDPSRFAAQLDALRGSVQIDRDTGPVWLQSHLANASIEWVTDPCILPKACKNAHEIKGMQEAHLRDAIAMVRFLAWLDEAAPTGTLTETQVVSRLETLRRADNSLRDISFETIAGSGPNGAIVHYRVTDDTDRTIAPGELLLVDSGGQYIDGTTDITRTVATGPVAAFEKRCFTRVLQGMIAISRARWPKGLAGRDLDALARAPLWADGLDYDHGTGHGVGAYLSVHEGPQRLSRQSGVPLASGMILSNEPGYYREGAFGIRLENLIVVQSAPDLPGQDQREMLDFSTLTWVPLDLRLVDKGLLGPDEKAWLNTYHQEVRTRLEPHLDPDVAAWLVQATSPI
jgi:Xaa-Pro aminopeptidase